MEKDILDRIPKTKDWARKLPGDIVYHPRTAYDKFPAESVSFGDESGWHVLIRSEKPACPTCHLGLNYDRVSVSECFDSLDLAREEADLLKKSDIDNLDQIAKNELLQEFFEWMKENHPSRCRAFISARQQSNKKEA